MNTVTTRKHTLRPNLMQVLAVLSLIEGARERECRAVMQERERGRGKIGRERESETTSTIYEGKPEL